VAWREARLVGQSSELNCSGLCQGGIIQTTIDS
jgi:hypothetical protein